MKMTRIIYFLLFVGGLLVSCDAAWLDSSSQFSSASICEINAKASDYIGSKIELHALYETDGMNYSYLRDPPVAGKSCKRGGIIEIGYMGQMQSQSVSRFREAEKYICGKRGKNTLCVLTADVIAEVQVLKDKNGIYVNLIDVRRFKFYNRSE